MEKIFLIFAAVLSITTTAHADSRVISHEILRKKILSLFNNPTNPGIFLKSF